MWVTTSCDIRSPVLWIPPEPVMIPIIRRDVWLREETKKKRKNRPQEAQQEQQFCLIKKKISSLFQRDNISLQQLVAQLDNNLQLPPSAASHHCKHALKRLPLTPCPVFTPLQSCVIAVWTVYDYVKVAQPSATITNSYDCWHFGTQLFLFPHRKVELGHLLMWREFHLKHSWIHKLSHQCCWCFNSKDFCYCGFVFSDCRVGQQWRCSVHQGIHADSARSPCWRASAWWRPKTRRPGKFKSIAVHLC